MTEARFMNPLCWWREYRLDRDTDWTNTLIERGDRRSLAALELLRPLSLAVRVRNALYHWTKP